MSNGNFEQLVRWAEQIESAENELCKYYSDSPLLFSITSRFGIIHHLNDAWEKHLGWTLYELRAKSWLTLVHIDDTVSLVKMIIKMETEPIVDVPIRFKRKANGDLHSTFSWTSSRWTPGGLTYAIGVFQSDR